jgi:DNA-binding LacI/PurR family transcriptional regulator
MSEKNDSKNVTLRDIAKRLGISHVTVSHGLRNLGQISEARRRQILETAREMGYRPNPMAVALGNSRTWGKAQPVAAGLAWLNHWARPKELLRYKEFELYWKGAYETASGYGYRLEEFVCDEKFPLKQLAVVLRTRNLHGILIPPHPGDLPPGWDEFPWDEFSVVRFGHSIRRPRFHGVASDQTGNGMLAFGRIHSLGYERIGYVTSMTSRTRFKAGFLMAQSEATVKNRLPMLVLERGEEKGSDARKLAQWIRKNRPDAILTEIAALGEMIRGAGHRIPEEIGLAAFSIHDGNADTGIDQNPREIGKAAAEMLVSMLNRNETGIPRICREMTIEGQWMSGSSLPARVGQSWNKI